MASKGNRRNYRKVRAWEQLETVCNGPRSGENVDRVVLQADGSVLKFMGGKLIGNVTKFGVTR